MSRIGKKFKELKKQGKKALIIYITAGYPSLAKTKELILEIEKNKADIIELGIPFSDPLADGPTIQRSSYMALKNGVTLEKIISLVKDIRKKTQIPIVFMTYYNPVLSFGVDRFVKSAKAAGVDGVIIPDLPPEEAKDLIKISRNLDFSDIFLLTPTSTKERVAIICKASSGFIYYVSLTGVTGARRKFPSELKNKISAIKNITKKPVCAGFGVSNAMQAAQMAKFADGVIIGSAVVNILHKNLGKKDLVQKIGRFVRGIRNATN